MTIDGNASIWVFLLALVVLAGKIWDWWVTKQAAEKLAKVTQATAVASANKVADVKQRLIDSNQMVAEKLDDIQTTSDKIHILSNNATSLMLKTIASDKERLAEMTKLAPDIAAAKAARQASEAHEAAQSKIDDTPDRNKQRQAQP